MRIAFLPYVWCCLFLLSSSVFCFPNVIIFYVDDLGFADIGFNNEEMERATPTFNDMASKGIILDQFYTSPTCTPSRASLLTGKYTIHIGLQDSVIHATEPRGLDLQYTLLPKKLASKGYKNYMLGKWHLGFHQKTYTPNKRGFDEFFGILTGGGGHYSHISSATFTVRGTEYKTNQLVFEGYNLWHNEVPVQEEEDPDVSNQHTTDIYTTKAHNFPLNKQTMFAPPPLSRRIFNKYDTDQSGSIDSTEFRNLCYGLGYFLSPTELDLAIKLLDKDGNKTISYQEFHSWWTSSDRFKKLSLDDERQEKLSEVFQTFKSFDTENSGVLKGEQITKLHKYLVSKQFTTLHRDAFLADLDTDRNMSISFNEFVDWISRQ